MRKSRMLRAGVGLSCWAALAAMHGASRAQGLPPIPPDLAKQLPPGLLPGLSPSAPPAGSTGGASTVPGKPSGPLPASVDKPQAGLAEWTVLVYADADNDLEAPILDDLDEMERVGSVKGVNVVMQIDRWRPLPGSPAANRDDTTNGDWDQARRYFVTRDDGSTKIHSLQLQDLGEVDMSHPKELASFLAWGVKTFPAKRYALVMEDHGSGWRGGFVDDNAPPEPKPIMMSLAELKDGLESGLKQAGIPKLDLFATDACLMAMLEIGDAIAPSVKYWVASEELQPGPGFEYSIALGALAKNPKMDGAALGKAFVDAMRIGYGKGSSGHDPTVTSAAFDMSKVPAVRAAVDALAKLLAADIESAKVPLGMSAEYVDLFGGSSNPVSGPKDGFADLVQVAAVVRETSSKKEVKAAAQAVIAAVDAARVDKFMGDDRPNGRGMSIWMPPPEVVSKGLPLYRKTPFGQSSAWASMLQQYGNAISATVAPKVSDIVVGKNPSNPFLGERPVSAKIEGDIRSALMIVSQDFLGNKVPVEVVAITDPALFKKLPEGPGVTAWKKGVNTVSAKWTPQYATITGKGGLEFPLVVNRNRYDSTSFDADVGLRALGGPVETVMLRFAMPKSGYAGSKLLTGYFIDQVQGQEFYTPFQPGKLPASKVAFEPTYTIVDPSGKTTQLRLPLQVKWDKIEDLKIQVRPMIPGKIDVTIVAQDFAGHVGVGKTSTTIP
jgi:hypothetical protein